MPGLSPRKPRPTSDGALADAESDDDGDSGVKEQDGYGDLLEEYGKIAKDV
jgi:hypothetical protein